MAQTLVCFHAHPDDECIGTGGTIAKAVADGHRVVLVVATRGELGEVPPGFLKDGEELWTRRLQELNASAEVLGVSRVEVLGYKDSGMAGEDTNNDPACFWQCDTEEAAKKLAAILQEENADVLTVYDANGIYGHPDHIQVHRVGHRAAELADTPSVFEGTVNRTAAKQFFEEQAAQGGERDENLPSIDELGVPEDQITTAIDVTKFLDIKRASMKAHPSQIQDTHFFMALPPDQFAKIFGTESFIHTGVPAGIHEDSLFTD